MRRFRRNRSWWYSSARPLKFRTSCRRNHCVQVNPLSNKTRTHWHQTMTCVGAKPFFLSGIPLVHLHQDSRNPVVFPLLTVAWTIVWQDRREKRRAQMTVSLHHHQLSFSFFLSTKHHHLWHNFYSAMEENQSWSIVTSGQSSKDPVFA